MAESKAAVTRIAPNGIFSQVKTSAFFKTTQQTPTLTLSSTSRLQQRNIGTTPQLSQQQQRLPPPPPLHPKPSISKPHAPQRPPPPPSSSSSSQPIRPAPKTTSVSRGPPPIPPRPARLTKNVASTLPPPPPSHSSNTNATIILEADLTMLRGATSSSNIMNSTKLDDTCNLQPILMPPPPSSLPLVAPRLSITQMVNAVEQSNVQANKEIEVLTNKMENTSIVLTSNNEIKSSPLASIEMKTPGSSSSNSSSSNHRQQTPKSVTMDFKAMRRSGHELKEFLNSGRDEESMKKLSPKKETQRTTSSSTESELNGVVVKDIKYYRNLVRIIMFFKF